MKAGQFEIDILHEGTMRVDGGGVFGIIPRHLWEKKAACDSKNRVLLGLRQLLIRGRESNILIDTGAGTKLNQRFREIFSIVNPPPWKARLKPFGLAPEDITHVIFTHLHFDHSGGATIFSENEQDVLPSFPNAKYIVQSGEWNEACITNERSRRSYFFEDFLPIQHEGKLKLINGDHEIYDGIKVCITGGHTRFHQMVVIKSGGRRIICPGDIFPTSNHVFTAWETSFDQFPHDTLEYKKTLLSKYLNTDTLFFFGHDPDGELKRITGTLDNPQTVLAE
ncbi:MAG: MBL fold metallo-hydrolase [Candidatus Riflebacteria bacterium]|nr:MBL fold metallo-hydrolase [Candidatus Riflebacteria bacterium]